MTDAPDEALRQAAAWFNEYGKGHAEKGATDKATRNFDRADYCSRAVLTATAKPQPVVVTDEMVRQAVSQLGKCGLPERTSSLMVDHTVWMKPMRTVLENFVRTHLSPSHAPQGMPLTEEQKRLLALFEKHPPPWSIGSEIVSPLNVFDRDSNIICSANLVALVGRINENAARPPEPKPEPFVEGWYWAKYANGQHEPRYFKSAEQQERVRDVGGTIGERIEPSFPDSAKSGRPE